MTLRRTFYADAAGGGSSSNTGTSSSSPLDAATLATRAATANYFNNSKEEIYLKRGSTFPWLYFYTQGHPSALMLIRDFGDDNAARPLVDSAGVAGALTAALACNNCYGVRIENVQVTNQKQAYIAGFGFTNYGSTLRTGSLQLIGCKAYTIGHDLVNIGTYNTSGLGTEHLISDFEGYDAQNDGVSFNGPCGNAVVEDFLIHDVGAGTSSPVNAYSGDGVTSHDVQTNLTVRRGRIHTVLDGLHLTNAANGPCGQVHSVLVYNYAQSGITCEAYFETLGTTASTLMWTISSCVFVHKATASSDAIVLARQSAGGDLISYTAGRWIAARLFGNTVYNQSTGGKYCVRAAWSANAQSGLYPSDECFLDARGNIFKATGSDARHLVLNRNGRTPHIVPNENLYQGDQASAFTLDGTSYNFAAWQALGYDANSTLGTVALVGDPSSSGDVDDAAPTLESTARGAGPNLSASYFYGAPTQDAAGRTIDDGATTVDAGAMQYAADGLVGTPHGNAIDGLVDALGIIGDTSQAWSTSRAVTQVIRDGMSSEGVVKPVIALTKTAYTYERVSVTGLYAKTLAVDFVFVFDGWDGFDQLGAVIADVELALGLDRTLGGTVDNVSLKNAVPYADGQDAAVTFTVELTFRTVDNQPLLRA